MICHKCGSDNHLGERFCNACGAPLDGAAQRQAEAKRQAQAQQPLTAADAAAADKAAAAAAAEAARDAAKAAELAAPPETRRQFYRRLAPKPDKIMITAGAIFCYINLLLAAASFSGGNWLALLDLAVMLLLPLWLLLSPRKLAGVALLLYMLLSLGLHFYLTGQLNNWPALIGAALLCKGAADIEDDWRQYQAKGSFVASI